MFSLGALITSKTRLRVLEFFLLHPDLELGVRETARALDSNPMLVRNELLRLANAGVLKSRRVANSIQYSLNTSCDAIAPLRQLLEGAHE
jgi:DNA-binding transcriptional ArsR family regulator